MLDIKTERTKCENSNVLLEIIETRVASNALGKKRRLSELPISHEIGELLVDLIRKERPKVTLEIGLAFGISALYICSALSEIGGKRHYIIDPNQSTEWDNMGADALSRAGHSKLIEIREQCSHVALPQLLAENIRIDFAFIDGWHVFDQVMLDFFYTDKLLRDGGVICFDDASWPSVRKALRYIVTNHHYAPVASVSSPYSKKELLARICAPISRAVGICKEELVTLDSKLGLSPGSKCVALRKIASDTREITFHRNF